MARDRAWRRLRQWAPAGLMDWVVDAVGDERDEQACDLVASERDEVVQGGMAGVFICADDGQEGGGEHGEGDPAGTGRVAADLALVQSGHALSGLERLLDPPP
ncbi:hypothetical protein ACIBBB_33090 [Streptomyces sp. NPDC051217]|uniref:hypothetical protein n=1 Tax=Streptomyces sp. NPDC051217 TaxID=3365644 RepID=UPI0037B7F2F8